MGSRRDQTIDLAGTDAIVRAVLASCLGDYHRHQAALIAQGDAEALHQARLALRRLRSALALFRPLTGPAPGLAGLRRLSAALGAVRDPDVQLAQVSHGPLHDRLVAVRAGAFAEAQARLRAAATRTLLRNLAEWIVMLPPMPDEPPRDFAAGRLDRWRRRVKRAGAALATGDEAGLHQLRRRAKRLHDAIDLVGSLFPAHPRRHVRLARALARLQAALGTLNDAVVSQAALAHLAQNARQRPPAPMGKTRRRALIAQAAAAHAEVLAESRPWR